MAELSKLPVLQTEVSRCSVPLKLIVDWSLENWLHQFELQDENKLILTCPYHRLGQRSTMNQDSFFLVSELG